MQDTTAFEIAFVAVFVLPVGLLVSILVMQLMGINANIMSLGGLALAISVMVDSSVVMIENAHKHLEREKERVAAGAAAAFWFSASSHVFKGAK